MTPSKTVIAAIAVSFLLPLIVYFGATWNVSFVTPEEILKTLKAGEKQTTVLYLGELTPEEVGRFDALIVPWRLEALLELRSMADAPKELQHQDWVLLCDGGVDAVLAAQHLLSLDGGGERNIRVVRGGFQALKAILPLDVHHVRTNYAFVETSLFKQWVSFGAAFVIKPIYMILSTLLLILLVKRRQGDLKWLTGAVAAFVLGENFCFLNYLLFNDDSYFVEFLHMYGMVVCFSLFVVWTLQTVRYRLIRFEGQKDCPLIRLCGDCTQVSQNNCKMDQLRTVLMLFFLVFNFLLFTVSFHEGSYFSIILGVPYAFMQPVMVQLYEIRGVPVLSILFLVVALALRFLGSNQCSNTIDVLMGFAVGHFCFGLLRMVLLAAYPMLIWFIAWEEITELLFVIFVIWWLWHFNPTVFPFLKKQRSPMID